MPYLIDESQQYHRHRVSGPKGAGCHCVCCYCVKGVCDLWLVVTPCSTKQVQVGCYISGGISEMVGMNVAAGVSRWCLFFWYVVQGVSAPI